MSPEYAMFGHFSEKSDVFSFGIILLEIISGQKSVALYDPSHALNLPTKVSNSNQSYIFSLSFAFKHVRRVENLQSLAYLLSV